MWPMTFLYNTNYLSEEKRKTSNVLPQKMKPSLNCGDPRFLRSHINFFYWISINFQVSEWNNYSGRWRACDFFFFTYISSIRLSKARFSLPLASHFKVLSILVGSEFTEDAQQTTAHQSFIPALVINASPSKQIILLYGQLFNLTRHPLFLESWGSTVRPPPEFSFSEYSSIALWWWWWIPHFEVDLHR